MDVELLSKMVVELISGHDSVSLPGVGTFLAAEIPATFSDKGFTINPPYRKLSFMPGGADDGLLTELYARSNSVDTDASKAILSHFLTEMKEALKNTKILVLPGLGLLRATRDNTFFFVPDEDLNIYPEGFGLPAVSLKNTCGFKTESFPVFKSAAVKTDAGISHENPAAAPAASVKTDSDQQPVDISEPRPTPKAKKSRWWIPVVAVTAVAAVLLALFLILAQVAPDFIDSILYTPEELGIINA